jgi:methylase of polypeptide subunit release factors
LLLTAEPAPYHTFFRLFILEQPVPEKDLVAALSPMPLEPLLDCHLLRRTPDGVQAAVKLAPHEQFYFVSDFPRHGPAATPPDHVLGVGGATASLASLTPRHPVKNCLDLCAGSGALSILASPRAGRVVGTDTNERALNFARFNAHLNGVNNIEWRKGSFFDPVQAEQFDLVMANPPFVISPESSLLYRDGGEGDAVSEHIVRGLPRHLAEGGFGVMLINWHHATESDWPVRPLQWLENNGCDGWLICIHWSIPLLYAAHWLRQTDHRDPDRYQRLLQQWTQYYKNAGMAYISSGIVILRKRSGAPNWTRHDLIPDPESAVPFGQHIARIFAAEDFLRSLPACEALLDHIFAVHPDLMMEQRLAMREGRWAIQELTMKLEHGFAFAGRVDKWVFDLLGHCDGQATLREAIERLARKSEVSATSLFSAYKEVARKLVSLGILIPQAASAT